MNLSETRALVRDFFRCKRGLGLSPAALAEAALFVESVFSISLSDDDICPETMGDVDAMVRLIVARRGAEA